VAAIAAAASGKLPPRGRRQLRLGDSGPSQIPEASNTIKSLSLSCRLGFFLSILKTIRSERAESFSLRQGVRFIIDANEGDAPVREITKG